MEPKVTIAINAARLAAKEIHKFSRRRDKINVFEKGPSDFVTQVDSICLLYTSPSPRDVP